MTNVLDSSNLYGSIIDLPKQCQHAYKATRNIVVPESYKTVNRIIMTGMGGSALGARIIDSVYGLTLPLPIFIINDYDLPQWANDHTLVISSSFSGTTEETLSITRQAIDRHCPWMAISGGGALHELALKHQVPAYKIDPVYNPSKQPRMAIGYSVIGQLALIAKLGLITLTQTEIDELILAMQQVIDKNNAPEVAQKFFNQQVIFVAGRHLTGAVHTIKNQMNENSKNLSHRYDLPELNHHLMEGLRFPASNQQDVSFFFVDSLLYSKRLRQRLQITQDIVAKNKIKSVTWTAVSPKPLTQVFEFIQFGALVNFHLSQLYKIDPADIPWVDYFKKQLGQPLGQWK